MSIIVATEGAEGTIAGRSTEAAATAAGAADSPASMRSR